MVKICHIHHVSFQTTSQFFFKFCILQCLERYLLYFYLPYFFSSNIIYFGQKEPIEVQIFQTFDCSGQNSPNSCHFWNKSVFLQNLHHSSLSWDITPLYCILYTYNKRNLSKCKFREISCEQLEAWNFEPCWTSFDQSISYFSWNISEKLCATTLNCDAKFKGVLPRGLKEWDKEFD